VSLPETNMLNNTRITPLIRILITSLALLMVPVFSASAGDEEAAVVWVDVRSWAEHAADNIEGDPRIHFSEIVTGVGEAYPDKSTPLRLYCAVGGRAGRGVEALRAAGYTNVENVGGIEDVRKLRDLTE